MIVLALLLLVAAAVLVVFIVVTGRTQTVDLTWEALNLSWAPSALVVFLLGALTLLLVVLALGLLRGGTKRKVEQRRELKRLRGVEKENATAAGNDRHGSETSGGAAAVGGSRAHPQAEETHGGHPSSANDQPTQAQPTQGRPTHDQSTHDQSPGDRPTQEQPPIYPRKAGPGEGQGSGHPTGSGYATGSGHGTTTSASAGSERVGSEPGTGAPAGSSDSTSQGSWHDEPGGDRPGGRHEAP